MQAALRQARVRWEAAHDGGANATTATGSSEAVVSESSVSSSSSDEDIFSDIDSDLLAEFEQLEDDAMAELEGVLVA